jgi:hypothetical protein
MSGFDDEIRPLASDYLGNSLEHVVGSGMSGPVVDDEQSLRHEGVPLCVAGRIERGELKGRLDRSNSSVADERYSKEVWRVKKEGAK